MYIFLFQSLATLSNASLSLHPTAAPMSHFLAQLKLVMTLVVVVVYFLFLFACLGYQFYYRDERRSGRRMKIHSQLLYMFCFIPVTLLYIYLLPFSLLYLLSPKYWNCGERGHLARNCWNR